MAVTAQRLLTELGNRNWSGFSIDDMVFESEDSRQAKTELNIALRYLINLDDFPFRTKEQRLLATTNVAEYNMPQGQIVAICDSETREQLTYIGNKKTYDTKLKGKPSGYWINYKNPSQKIRLYPIPDKTNNYIVYFNQFKPVLGSDNIAKFEFEKADDIINLPSNLEYLFMDCIVLRTMITNNKDEQDENYRPTIDEFNQAWKLFTKACKPVKLDVRVVW